MAGKTVLVIDDDADLRAVAVEALEDVGYDAIPVPDVAAGLTVLGAVVVDLVLLDEDTGFMPAEEFVRIARVRCPGGVRVLLWTGRHDATSWAAALGADGALEKPTDLDALRTRVRQEIGAP